MTRRRVRPAVGGLLCEPIHGAVGERQHAHVERVAQGVVGVVEDDEGVAVDLHVALPPVGPRLRLVAAGAAAVRGLAAVQMAVDEVRRGNRAAARTPDLS